MTAEDLLRKCATQFRFYERNHRAKAAALAGSGLTQNMEAINDTLAKAEANKGFAEEIEEFLGDKPEGS